MKNKLHSLLHRHPGLLALVTVELAVCLLLLLRAAGRWNRPICPRT